MTDYTKEPWEVINNESLQPIVCHGDKLIASTFWSEDARRIVACVNACARIPTESLEAGGVDSCLKVMREQEREISIEQAVNAQLQSDIREERAKTSALLEDMKTLKNILGPSEPTCYGCTVEIDMALSVINRALERVKQ